MGSFVGKDASLGKAVHTHSDFDVHPTLFINKSSLIVLRDDFVGDEFESESHVFIFFHGSHEVEV